MMALFDQEKAIEQFGIAAAIQTASPAGIADTEALSGAFFFCSRADGTSCLGFSADSKNPSTFLLPDPIHKKAL